MSKKAKNKKQIPKKGKTQFRNKMILEIFNDAR